MLRGEQCPFGSVAWRRAFGSLEGLKRYDEHGRRGARIGAVSFAAAWHRQSVPLAPPVLSWERLGKGFFGHTVNLGQESESPGRFRNLPLSFPMSMNRWTRESPKALAEPGARGEVLAKANREGREEILLYSLVLAGAK